MLTQLLDWPAALAIAIVVVALLNHLIATATMGAIAHQTVVEVRDSVSTPPSARAGMLSPRIMMRSLGLAAVIVVLTFVPSRLMRETISGGYLVLQLTTVVINLDSLFRMRALGMPGAAEGHVHFSASYRFRASAGQLFALGLLNAAVAWLFNSVTFLVGCLFVFATALGWYRRARQTGKAPGPQ
jgi:hypothetical protein